MIINKIAAKWCEYPSKAVSKKFLVEVGNDLCKEVERLEAENKRLNELLSNTGQDLSAN